MKTLPEHLVAYKKTPVFSETTVPAGLLKEHQTKAGAWGKIVVLEGELEYTINEPETETLVLTPARFGVVEPQILHQVKPLGTVQFYVEFYRAG
ncbi:DUF1971 domain-containing protein [Simiduia sp. 21SJ11W-1]|uniref:DUF1971 domain-containing protein n=1 Tax=Simiduia sp. 21SJ11W-1 TaxID=2909669 RepID=UPI00209D9348|nr:DUF1971 domain-containing protein [Simiduia sp. 21SJ11W-1]UTA48046.1 DUF1971 domain-containing protein [Simiduia sp. 21SJ11W-1]